MKRTREEFLNHKRGSYKESISSKQKYNFICKTNNLFFYLTDFSKCLNSNTDTPVEKSLKLFPSFLFWRQASRETWPITSIYVISSHNQKNLTKKTQVIVTY
jgi:hypothetical protein